MASLRTSATQSALRSTRKKTPYICPRCELRQNGFSPVNFTARNQTRHSSTDTAIPPLLAKIKNDLKAAMKAKDTPRLNVLRSMISEYNNASKTAHPIKTDMQLLSALRKKRNSSIAAADEFSKANRQDLEEKQMQEVKVMDEYYGSVKLLTEDEIRQALREQIDILESGSEGVKPGNVLKELFKPGGKLDGKPVDKAYVAEQLTEWLNRK